MSVCESGTYMWVCECVCVHYSVNVCMQVCICMCIPEHLCMCVYACTHTQVCAFAFHPNVRGLGRACVWCRIERL